MKKTNFTAYSLNPGKDRDALLVLMISLIILILSAGLFFIGLTYLVFQKAINTSAGDQHPESIFLVFGKKLIDGKPDPDYRARLERLLKSCFHSAILMGGTTGDSKISEAEAANILKSQLSIDEKVAYADFVINNEKSVEETKKQVNKVWRELKKIQK